MNEGWIKTHRQVMDNEIWTDEKEPHDKRSAWIELLLLCNHSDKQIVFDGSVIEIKRGQYVTSVRKLAERWGWGKDKTLKYLKLLETLHMIDRETDTKKTVITVVNYGFYQASIDDEQTPNETPNRQLNRHESATNKNVKNDKNDNKEILPKGNIKKATAFTPPTLDEVKSYCSERGNGVDAERWFDFYQAKGWMVGKNKMKDWKAAVRTWERNDTCKNNTEKEIKKNDEPKPYSNTADIVKQILQERGRVSEM